MVKDQLGYQGEVHISFSQPPQWVSIKSFGLIDVGITDRDVVESLLGQARYRDSYTSPHGWDKTGLHGPYILEYINADSYSPVNPTDTETLLRTWSAYYGTMDEQDRGLLERELYPRIRNADGCYQLADLGDSALPDWGSVVGDTGFFDYVLINRSAREVALVVASDD